MIYMSLGQMEALSVPPSIILAVCSDSFVLADSLTPHGSSVFGQ